MRMKETIQAGEKTHDGGEKTGFTRPAYHPGIPGRAGYHPIYPASRQIPREPARVRILFTRLYTVIGFLIRSVIQEDIYFLDPTGWIHKNNKKLGLFPFPVKTE
jgi:hypothetical protein